MKKDILLPLKAIHFKDTSYSSNCLCPIANAATDFFNTVDVSEEVHDLYVGKRKFTHTMYSFDTFKSDYTVALRRKFAKETTIRHIILKEVKNE